MARTRTGTREPEKNKYGQVIVGGVGDVNFPEYDGGEVLKTESGDYELEYVEAPSDDVDFDDKDARWTIYRVNLDQEVPSQGSIKSVAKSAGQRPSDLKKAFESDDPMERANAYVTWAGYYGWNEFDQYPLVLDKKSVEDRYDTELGSGDEEEEEEEEEEERD